MLFRGQSAVEWLITHGWSILIVLSVGIFLFHLGVFDVEGTPRFEGLRAAGLQPVSGQVRLYSDGVMVLTVLNTRPYTMELEWVEVSPIADSGDVVRTDLNAVLTAGELGVFEVNAPNIYPGVGASVLLIPEVSAKSKTVDFHIWMKESYSAGGKTVSHVVSGTGYQIPYVEQTSPGGSVDVCNDGCILEGYESGSCLEPEPPLCGGIEYPVLPCPVPTDICCCWNAAGS